MIDRFSGILGLLAFVLASSLGLITGKPTDHVLFSALIAMVAFVIFGKVLGFMAKKIIAEVVKTMPEEELAGIEAEELVEGKAAVVESLEEQPPRAESPAKPPEVPHPAQQGAQVILSAEAKAGLEAKKRLQAEAAHDRGKTTAA